MSAKEVERSNMLHLLSPALSSPETLHWLCPSPSQYTWSVSSISHGDVHSAPPIPTAC